METFILKPNTQEQVEALKAIAKAMKIYCEKLEDMALGVLLEQAQDSEVLNSEEANKFLTNLSK